MAAVRQLVPTIYSKSRPAIPLSNIIYIPRCVTHHALLPNANPCARALVPFHALSLFVSFLSALAVRLLPTFHSMSSSDSKPAFEAPGRVELAELRVAPTSVIVRHDARYVHGLWTG